MNRSSAKSEIFGKREFGLKLFIKDFSVTIYGENPKNASKI